jgi:hypothetical protein
VEGSLVRYNEAKGLLYCKASSSRLKLDFMNVNGDVIDSLTLRK